MYSMRSEQSELVAHRLYTDDERETVPTSTPFEIHSRARIRLPSSLCKPSLRTYFDWDDSGNDDYAKRPALLDLFAGGGGAAMGYYLAGFRVVGVDIKPQPHYPFKFYLADALTFPLEGYDAYHASPPCQAYSIMLNLPWLKGREYPKLIPVVRELFVATAKPYVLENVAGARYRQSLPEGLQAGYLCGQMFGLPIFRHRYFETNFFWFQPGHPKHQGHIKDGRKLGGRAREIIIRKTGQTYGFDRPESAVGHAAMGGISARKALGVEWMSSRDEASQAIPPVYTEYIGKYLIRGMRLE